MTRSLLLFVSALVFAACPAMASTYYVGTCHTKSFPSISAAVSAVPEGSVIDVCPGYYTEQVMISKSLTLQGITSQNSTGATVASFSGSVAESQILGLDLIPAIWVTAGTVSISNLLVVSSSAVSSCSQLPTGIFYASGTSGTVNHVYVEAGGIAAAQELSRKTTLLIVLPSRSRTATLTLTISGSSWAASNQKAFFPCCSIPLPETRLRPRHMECFFCNPVARLAETTSQVPTPKFHKLRHPRCGSRHDHHG